MTTAMTNGNGGAPAEDPWAEGVEPGSGMRTKASEALQALPGELDVASEAVAGAVRAVSSGVAAAPDDSLLVGAAVASGLALGLLLASGPRLLAAVSVLTAVSLGASLVQRHPRRRAPRMGSRLTA